MRVVNGLDELEALVGIELGTSAWVTVTQEMTSLYVKTAAQEASLSCWRVRKSLMTR